MRSIVVTVRDPDWSNEYAIFGEPVEIIDIDAGYADLRDPEEFAEWKDSHLTAAAELERQAFIFGRTHAREAADYIRSVVASYEENVR